MTVETTDYFIIIGVACVPRRLEGHCSPLESKEAIFPTIANFFRAAAISYK